jgi:Glutathione S-transferase, N-terminal domain
MKLYMHPVSTASRPVRLFIAENGIKCDEEAVDILKGAHYQEPYASLNPNRMVPMLEDGDFRLTERLWTDLSATLSAPQAPKRGGSQRCSCLGTARREELAADSQRPLDRAQKPISLRQRNHRC